MFRPQGRRGFYHRRFPRVCGDVPVGSAHYAARRFPRVCGDVPYSATDNGKNILFSPRVRGCSDTERNHHEIQDVFPACAGMFLMSESSGIPDQAFSPRVRGCSS